MHDNCSNQTAPHPRIRQLQNALQDPAAFAKAIAPVQFSAVMAKLFTAMAVTVGALFLLPALWHAIQGRLMLSETYAVRFNALMGGGIACFLALLALICFVIARFKREPLLQKLHQAYLEQPTICEIKAVMKRGPVTLCAYAKLPGQQLAIEQLLTQTFQGYPQAYEAAYARIANAHVKHKAHKAQRLKKQLQKINPALQAYDFYLNWTNSPMTAKDTNYYLFMPTGLLPVQGNYILIQTNAIAGLQNAVTTSQWQEL